MEWCGFLEVSELLLMKQLEQVISNGIDRGVFPGAVVCLYREDQPLFLRAYGDRMITPQRLPMCEDTLFDLASLTKPVVTAPSVMLLKEQGLVRLDDDLSDYLPEFTRRGLSIFHLLTHTSGLQVDGGLNFLSVSAQSPAHLQTGITGLVAHSSAAVVGTGIGQ